MSRGIIRYIDGDKAFRAARAPNPDAWVLPTYTRWMMLGIAATGLLMAWAMGGAR